MRRRLVRWLSIAALAIAAVPLLGLAFLVVHFHLDLASSLRAALRKPARFTVAPDRLALAGYGPVTYRGSIANARLDELSGLAVSRRRDDLLWALNDSGDGPFLYALGADGSDRGVVTVRGAFNRDWEDLAAFELDGAPYLLIADVGDNFSWRPAVTLYIVPEPELRGARFGAGAEVTPKWVLRVRFPDGPADCEAVGVDAPARRILLLQKRVVPPVLFAVELQPRHDDPQSIEHLIVARRLGAVPGIPQPTRAEIAHHRRSKSLSRPTAMDVSPDARRAIVFTYKEGYLFERAPGESWASAFSRLPLRVPSPPMQGLEAAAFARDGRTIYASSEGRPTPLFMFEPPAPAR